MGWMGSPSRLYITARLDRRRVRSVLGMGTALRLAGVAAVLVLVAAACGDSGDDETTTDSDTTETTATSEDTDTTAVDGEELEPGTIDDNNVVHGTAGYTIDLNDCPSGWSNTEGVSDDEIKLAHSFVFSGTLAAYGAISEGMAAVFDWAAEQTPEDFGGRTISLEAIDDGYEPARVLANTEQILETVKPFAVPTMAGTPGNLAIFDLLNDECVPHIFPGTGHPAFADPANHPWSTMNYLAYTTEGGLWGQYLLDLVDAGELQAPVSIAFLQTNNDFGAAWDLGLKEFVAEHPDELEIVAQELFESSAPNITNEMTTLSASDAEVFIAGVVGVSCTQVLTEMAQSSWDPQVKINGSVCSGVTSFWEPAGDAGDGWVIAVDRKDISDPAYENDEFVIQMRTVLEDAGLDWRANANVGRGAEFAQPTLEALRQANTLAGGITRTNVMVASYSMDFEHGMGLPGNRWVTNGLEDAYPSEQAQFFRYVADDLTFIPETDIIDLSGTTPLCVWDGASCG